VDADRLTREGCRDETDSRAGGDAAFADGPRSATCGPSAAKPVATSASVHRRALLLRLLDVCAAHAAGPRAAHDPLASEPTPISPL